MPEIGTGETYRLKGHLERENPTIKPLEPTPITSDARSRLESWGIPDPFITRLQELTSSMRYDLCPQKAERIARNGGYIYERPDQRRERVSLPESAIDPETEGYSDDAIKQEVILPNFHNFKDSLDGECADTAFQLFDQLQSTGYLSEVNSELEKQGRPKLHTWFLIGKDRRYFIGHNMSHAFLGFLPEDSSSVKSAIGDFVVVDPSLQEISNQDCNGYTINRFIDNPKPVGNMPLTEVFPVGSYSEDGALITSRDIRGPQILGTSFDQALIYGLAFAENSTDKVIRPVLVTLLPEGKEKVITVISSDGKLIWSGNDEMVTTAHKEEVGAILKSLSTISLVRDQETAAELKHSKELEQNMVAVALTTSEPSNNKPKPWWRRLLTRSV